MGSTAHTSSARRVRWWPLVSIAVLLATMLVWIWTAFGEQRQSRVLATIAAVGLASILALLWLLLLSRMRPRTRMLLLGGLLAIVSLLVLSVERRGVSGDVVPQMAWRWAARGPGVASPEGPSGLDRTRDVFAGDYPQFQGPERDGVLLGGGLASDWTDWERNPPRELWRRPVGAGWSGFAVVGPYAVTQEQRDDKELVTCYDRLTGRLIWVHENLARHDDPFGGAGPRATPTIVGDRVFALGATGRLDALDLVSGKRLWSVDTLADAEASPPTYGVAASPLVTEEMVIVGAGGRSGSSLVAYDFADGTRRWSGGGDPAAYSSPTRLRLAGVDQVVWLNGSNLTAHDPSDGTVLWSQPWPGGTERVSQPVRVDSESLFVSTGYGVGGKLFRIERGPEQAIRSRVVWESRSLKSKFANVVLHDGYLYGLDDGILVCVDARDGRRVWKRGRYGHGQLILVGDVLLIQTESGEVALVSANPEQHQELARISALEGKTWNSPALAGHHLLIRNDREAACYELAPALDESRQR